MSPIKTNVVDFSLARTKRVTELQPTRILEPKDLVLKVACYALLEAGHWDTLDTDSHEARVEAGEMTRYEAFLSMSHMVEQEWEVYRHLADENRDSLERGEIDFTTPYALPSEDDMLERYGGLVTVAALRVALLAFRARHREDAKWDRDYIKMRTEVLDAVHRAFRRHLNPFLDANGLPHQQFMVDIHRKTGDRRLQIYVYPKRREYLDYAALPEGIVSEFELDLREGKLTR